jgi:hypothetical protein
LLDVCVRFNNLYNASMASHCGGHSALDYSAEPWLRLTVELDGIWECDDSIG